MNFGNNGFMLAASYYAVPLLLVVAGASYLLARRFFWQKQIASMLVPVGAHVSYLLNFSLTKKVIKTALLVTALSLLAVALLRPQWGAVEQSIVQEGRDILIAVDISRSMCAQDLKPDRITVAKEKIKKLVSLIPDARFALLPFSGSAIVVCPLTADNNAFLFFVDALEVEPLSQGTTALDKVLERAILMVNTVAAKKNKLLLVFTDGEDFSTQLSRYKKQAEESGLHIFTIGMGTTEGAPIPLFDESGVSIGHQLDEKGSVVISRLNEQLLQTLSHDSGASYSRATQNNKDVEFIMDKLRAFEKEQSAEIKSTMLQERYHYFGFLSLVLFFLEWLL